MKCAKIIFVLLSIILLVACTSVASDIESTGVCTDVSAAAVTNETNPITTTSVATSAVSATPMTTVPQTASATTTTVPIDWTSVSVVTIVCDVFGAQSSATEVTTRYAIDRIEQPEIFQTLLACFAVPNLVPTEDVPETFSPLYFLDFNNGFTAAVSLDSTYCQAGMAQTKFCRTAEVAETLQTQGGYRVSTEALAYLAEFVDTLALAPAQSPAAAQPTEYALLTFDHMGSFTDFRYEHYDLCSPAVCYTVTDAEIVAALRQYLTAPEMTYEEDSFYRTTPNLYISFSDGYRIGLYIAKDTDGNGQVAERCVVFDGKTVGILSESSREFLFDLAEKIRLF